MDRNALEQDIQAAGRTAARITPTHVQESIASEHYFTAGAALKQKDCYSVYADPDALFGHSDGGPLDLLTICVLVLTNGYTVIGTSACASPENFDPEIGRKAARGKATDQVYALLGFRLRDSLSLAAVKHDAGAPQA